MEDNENQDRVILDGVPLPPPVFFCTIEAENSREQKQLESILENLSREDPSIQVKVDSDQGTAVVSGQGELHLEILRDRIEIEYGIRTELGTMRVAYRESVGESHEEEMTLEKKIGKLACFAQLTLKIETTLDEVDVSEL